VARREVRVGCLGSDGVATLTVLGFMATRYAHLTMFYIPLVTQEVTLTGDFSVTIVQLSGEAGEVASDKMADRRGIAGREEVSETAGSVANVRHPSDRRAKLNKRVERSKGYLSGITTLAHGGEGGEQLDDVIRCTYWTFYFLHSNKNECKQTIKEVGVEGNCLEPVEHHVCWEAASLIMQQRYDLPRLGKTACSHAQTHQS
jgi:hypothetical protein